LPQGRAHYFMRARTSNGSSKPGEAHPRPVPAGTDDHLRVGRGTAGNASPDLQECAPAFRPAMSDLSASAEGDGRAPTLLLISSSDKTAS
ncbi:hypothetical protein, partial [Klebsiella pneumoniae]|uniref:hypothetical protein n=1 Tax=Klebsiella pneumoniae TaxID=573 RepID=UPI003B9821E3